jgi:hypothetical protein
MEDNKIPKVENEQIHDKIEDAILNEQNTLPYTPMSKLPNLGTMIPLALAGETLQAQYKFKEEIPNVDAYLVEKLKYSSKLALADAFAAEQADAVAMAIYQFEKNKGLILADMAGIGKGRVNAGVLRYAYVNGYLPIFITEKPNLFSAIYRDIKDIGGLATKLDKPYLGRPLILNGYKSGGTEKIYDERGKLVRIKKPSETGIIDRVTGKEIITAPEQDEIKKIIRGDKLPKEFDYILLTYSQLMEDKVNFLHRVFQKLDYNVVISMDEVHNAAGATSSVGTNTQGLLTSCKGALYSSATFSKRPDNMFLYAIKTDVSESPIGTEALIKVIKAGGERLTENLAANIVASQQMLRREKTYDNCNIFYEYMSEEDKNSSFEKYDKTLRNYRKIVDFFDTNKNYIYQQAKINAINRFAKKNKVKLAEPYKKGEDKKAWKFANEGRYYVNQFTIGEVNKSQFNFIESLLFSLKADFVSDLVLGQIQDNKLESLSVETKQKFFSNRKPVIAVRNTLEGIYANLGYEVGDTIPKADFSLFLLSYVMGALSGVISLKEIVAAGTPKVFKDPEFEILYEDFPDKGESYRKLVEEVEELDLNVPLSPIDYIIDKIESTPRESWDRKYNQSQFYTLGEVTGRKFRLKKQDDGSFVLELNKRDKNKASAFKKFNDGIYDVLLINESGSTGEDAHSSRNFKDTRPRCMIVHQVELDVNTEVQKRGRINRTGMINYPTYIYAVSRIPSEIRRLLMLAKKMRSLDANTTANQKQSSKLSQIQDKFGNPVEDIMNEYGEDVLTEFLSSPENDKYKQYLPTDDEAKLQKLTNELIIEAFCRRLELAYSEDQEEFYDTINPLYIEYTNKLKEAGTYDLETSTKDLKGAIKNRAIISRGADTSPFNASVYEEDDYVLAEDRPLPKDRVEDMIVKLAQGNDPKEHYAEFLKDFQTHYKEYQIPKVRESVAIPDYKLAKDELEREMMRAEYEMLVSTKVSNLESEHNAIMQILKVLKPGIPCLIPANLEECSEVDADGLPVVPRNKNRARFIGYNLLSGAKDKYSPMNIELVFCQLSGKSKISFKPTRRGREVLEWIQSWLERGLNIVDLQAINQWYIDPNRREMMKLLTGDVLSAYSIATTRVNEDDSPYTKRVEFLKFTTADESAIRFGIRIYFRANYQEIDPNNLPVTYPLNSPYLIDDLLNPSNRFIDTFDDSVTFNIEKTIYSNLINIRIFGGTAGMQPKDPSKRKYYSPLYDNALLQEFLEDNNYDVDDFRDYRYKPVGAKKSTTLRGKCINISKNDSEASSKITELFNKIYEYLPFLISMNVKAGEEAIKGRKDIPLDAKGEDKSEVGEFKYILLVPYDSISTKIGQFSKFQSYEKTDKGYGTIVLNRRATAIEATTYSLMPINPTPKQMVTDTLSLFTDNARLDFNQKIQAFIKDGDPKIVIGIYIEEQISGKVLTLRNIFGVYADDYEFIGNLFVNFEEGKIEDFELPDKDIDEYDYDEDKMDYLLDYDTAQDFLISLISKIR